MPWTDEARARLEAIPSFLTAMIVARVESAARDAGHGEVTPALMKEIRERAAWSGPPVGRRRAPQR